MEPVGTGENKEFIISCMDKKQKNILTYVKLRPGVVERKKYIADIWMGEYEKARYYFKKLEICNGNQSMRARMCLL